MSDTYFSRVNVCTHNPFKTYSQPILNYVKHLSDFIGELFVAVILVFSLNKNFSDFHKSKLIQK